MPPHNSLHSALRRSMGDYISAVASIMFTCLVCKDTLQFGNTAEWINLHMDSCKEMLNGGKNNRFCTAWGGSLAAVPLRRSLNQ